MKTKNTLTSIALALLALATLLDQPSTAHAQGTAFTYQGQLLNNGSPANGNYDLRFTLYDALTSGSAVAGLITNSPTAVSNGLFTVTLDFGAGAFSGPSRWLDIAVRTNGSGSFVALSPRQALTPAPYAIYANTASNVAPGSVVNSLNNLKDNVTLAAGTNISITASGNALTIASAGSGIWSQNGTSTYYNAGNVGIGTANPPEQLTIAGVNNYNSGLKLSGSSSAGVGLALENTTLGGHKYDLISGGAGDSIGVGAFGLFDETQTTYRLSVAANGFVGIGVTTPLEQLTVGGEAFADTKIGVHALGDNYAALRMANNAGAWLWQVTPSNDLPGGRLRLTDEYFGFEAISITHNGNVGIGTINPASKLDVTANSDAIHGTSTGGGIGVYGDASGSGEGVHGRSSGTGAAVNGTSTGSGTGVYGASASGFAGYFAGNVEVTGFHQVDGRLFAYGGVDATGSGSAYSAIFAHNSTGLAGNFVGDVFVSGNLSKGGGSFKIDHPLDPANKYLSHSFVESPDMMNIYNGNLTLDDNGEAVVQMPAWFSALNKEFRYQLTCIGGFAPVYIAEEIANNRFKIAGGKRGLKVSWQVTGIRQDAWANAHRIPVEETKEKPDTYLHPELFGQPAEKSALKGQH